MHSWTQRRFKIEKTPGINNENSRQYATRDIDVIDLPDITIARRKPSSNSASKQFGGLKGGHHGEFHGYVGQPSTRWKESIDQVLPL